MHTSRAVSVVLALAAVGMLATGTLGFTSVSAERGVSVNVVENENAYVGVTACAPTSGNRNGAAKVYVSVSNQYSTEMTVDTIEGADGHSVEPKPSKESVETGTQETYPFEFNTSEVTVRVFGEGFDAAVTADVSSSRSGECNPGNGS